MKVLIQRVKQAAVTVEDEVVGQIAHGMLLLVGLEKGDAQADLDWHINKLLALRIFADEAGKMNRAIAEVGGAFLVVSQFTLAASCRKGTRPSFDHAMPPEEAAPMFERFVTQLRDQSQLVVETGRFGAMMAVSLVNDGPVTFLL